MCAVVPSSTSGANYWGGVFFFFFLRSTNMSPSSKPAATQLCGNRVIAGGSLLRVLLTLRLKQETVPPFSHWLPALPWSLAALRVLRRVTTCSLTISLTKMNADCGDAALDSIIKKKSSSYQRAQFLHHCHNSCYGDHKTRKAFWDAFRPGWANSSWVIHYNPNVLQSGVGTPRPWS